MPIQARDLDSLNYPVQYYFQTGTEGYSNYFSIDPTSGEITQTAPISREDYREMSITVLVCAVLQLIPDLMLY